MKKPKVKYPHGIYVIDARGVEVISICDKGVFVLLPTMNGFEWMKITLTVFKELLSYGTLTPINKVPYEKE